MRWSLGLLSALLVVAMVAPTAPAVAATRSHSLVRDLEIKPKAPKANQSVRVSFKAAALRPDRRFDVSLRVADAAGCSGGYAVRVADVIKRGGRVTVRLDPRDRRAVGPERNVPPGRFCAGPAVVTIGHAGADGRVVALKRQRILISPSGGPETFGVPAKITIVEGSAIVVRAPSRPERLTALTGVLRGYLPGLFKPNTDITVSAISGGLWVRSLQVDPLCAGAPILTDFTAVGGEASKLLLAASGVAKLTLALKADAISLAGCAGGAAATTTLTLTGKVTPDGLLKLPLTGTLDGVTIAPGVTAAVTISLLVNVDLSGRA